MGIHRMRTLEANAYPIALAFSPDANASYVAKADIPDVSDSDETASDAGAHLVDTSDLELSFTGQFQQMVQSAAFTSTLVRTLNTGQWSPPSPDPAGIVYLPASNALLVTDSEVNETSLYVDVNVFELTLGDKPALRDAWTTVSFADEPTGVTVNPDNGHLFISDDTGSPRSIYELEPGSDGKYGTGDDVVSSFDAGAYGNSDPEDLTYAAELNALFVADGSGSIVFMVSPGENGFFEGVAPAGDDKVRQFDTTSLGLENPKGIAYNPATGYLYLVGRNRSLLYEVTTGGELVQTIDISEAFPQNPEGLALAPSSVNPAETSIYIVALGVDNNADPDENDGMIYEMTLPSDWSEVVILISSNSQALANDLEFEDEDIVAYDKGTGQWHMVFDGSDVLHESLDVNAVALLDEGNPLPTILMSLSTLTRLPNIGWVYPQDIVKFAPTSLGDTTAGQFSLYLDGSDADLSTLGERIDGIGFAPDGSLVISTLGDFSVPGLSGGDEDLIVRKKGAWQIYFEGSDIGLSESSEDIWGTWINARGDIYLTTKDQFYVPAFIGESHNIYQCSSPTVEPNTTCNDLTLFWESSDAGLHAASIDGLVMTSRATISNLPTYPVDGYAASVPGSEVPNNKYDTYDDTDDIDDAVSEQEEVPEDLHMPLLYK